MDLQHINILRQGTAIWNHWRNDHLEIEPDLEDADLSSTDLTGINLQNANLNNANLRAVTLTRANLKGAALNMTNLSESVVEEAGLSGIDTLAAARLPSLLFDMADIHLEK